MHVGTVAQGRFSRLCAIFGQQRVLESLPEWRSNRKIVEFSRCRKRPVLAWLKDSLRGYGLWATSEAQSCSFPLTSRKRSPKTAKASGSRFPAGPSHFGRVATSWTCCTTARLFKKGCWCTLRTGTSRSLRMEFIVVTRHSTLERDTEAMLGRRYVTSSSTPSRKDPARKGN
jgi:hypothetical protein